MPADDDAPSARWCLLAALLPAIPFSCVLGPTTLLWWFPAWVAVFYVPLPKAVPRNYVMCVIAVYRAMDWTRRWAVILGTVVLAQLMHLAHQALWDAAEP